jgi:hypothetical protein
MERRDEERERERRGQLKAITEALQYIYNLRKRRAAFGEGFGRYIRMWLERGFNRTISSSFYSFFFLNKSPKDRRH